MKIRQLVDLDRLGEIVTGGPLRVAVDFLALRTETSNEGGVVLPDAVPVHDHAGGHQVIAGEGRGVERGEAGALALDGSHGERDPR